ncbi:MAG: hypothetical protein D3917_07055 [Candidatus Electrothrix sp. AX5]|nr:hypothetical protein [Candidatus Electrothrix sp. AX5]
MTGQNDKGSEIRGLLVGANPCVRPEPSGRGYKRAGTGSLALCVVGVVNLCVYPCRHPENKGQAQGPAPTALY